MFSRFLNLYNTSLNFPAFSHLWTRKLMLEARWHNNYFIVPKVQIKFGNVHLPSIASSSTLSYHMHFKNISQNLIFTTECHIYGYFKRFPWRNLKYILKVMSDNWRNTFFTAEMHVHACLCMYIYNIYIHTYSYIYIMAHTDTWFAGSILSIHACSLLLCG